MVPLLINYQWELAGHDLELKRISERLLIQEEIVQSSWVTADKENIAISRKYCNVSLNYHPISVSLDGVETF